MNNYTKTHQSLSGIRPDTNTLRLLIAQRADRLVGRQRRRYNPQRATEIQALQDAYRVLNAAIIATTGH